MGNIENLNMARWCAFLSSLEVAAMAPLSMTGVDAFLALTVIAYAAAALSIIHIRGKKIIGITGAAMGAGLLLAFPSASQMAQASIVAVLAVSGLSAAYHMVQTIRTTSFGQAKA